HNLKVEFFCLWQLKLAEPPIPWDTFIHEKAIYLGKNHAKYRVKPGSEGLHEIIAKEEAIENEQFSYSLVATCQRYGVSYAMEGDKKRLQKSFLDHADKAPFTEEQIQYAAEDAIAAARLY